jgi:MFS family permease
MAEQTKKKLTGGQIATLVGVLSVYMCAPTQSIPNVITSELANVYPTVDPGTLSYFLTITSMVAMLGAFLFGLLAGKFIKFQVITHIALVCFLVGGVGPMFFPDGAPFVLLLISRALLGLALGCFTPMAQSVIISMFEDEKTRSYWLGFGGAVFNVAITLGSTVAGMLALISWKTVFAFYFIGLIPLVVFALFFKEPDNIAVAKKETGPKVGWGEIPWRVYIIMICFMLSMMILGFFTSFGRMALNDVGVNPALFGTIMSVRTIGSILVALCFGFIYRFLKKYVLVAGCLLIAVSFAIFYACTASGNGELIILYVAGFCMGFGMNMLTVGMAQILSILTKPIVLTFVLGLNTFCMNAGTFISSPASQVYFGIVGDTPVYPIFLLAIVIAVILAVVNGVVMASAKKREDDTPHEAA